MSPLGNQKRREQLRMRILSDVEKALDALEKQHSFDAEMGEQELDAEFYDELLRRHRKLIEKHAPSTAVDKGHGRGARSFEYLGMWATAESIVWAEAVTGEAMVAEFRLRWLDSSPVPPAAVEGWITTRCGQSGERGALLHRQPGRTMQVAPLDGADPALLALADLVAAIIQGGVPWHEAQAVNFILTGLVPYVHPVDLSDSPVEQTVSGMQPHRWIRVSPLVGPGTIAWVFKQWFPAPLQLNDDDGRLVLLATFVIHRLGTDKQRWPTEKAWKAVYDDWLRTKGAPYRGDRPWRSFRRAAIKAVSRFIEIATSGAGVLRGSTLDVGSDYVPCAEDEYLVLWGRDRSGFRHR